MNTAKIKKFSGTWDSGIGFLHLEDETGKQFSVPCDNPATVRALDACFGDVIAPGHRVNSPRFLNQWIEWDWDEFGLMLGAFRPLVKGQ